MRFLLPYLRRHRLQFAAGIGALIVKDAAGVVLPLMIRGAIDSLTAGLAMSRILWFAGAMILICLIKGIFQYWMRVILIGASRDIEFEIRNDLFRKLVSLSPDYYGKNRTGDIMARSTNDLNAVRMMLGPGVMYWLETSLTFAMTLAVMLFADWRLALLSVVPAPLVSFAVIFFGRRIHSRFEAIQKQFSDISSRVQENLAGVRMVRAFAQEDAEVRKFEVLNRDYIEQNLKAGSGTGRFPATARSADRADVPDRVVERRPRGAARASFRRQLRHVQHLHEHAGVANDRAWLGGEPDAAGTRVAGADPEHPGRNAHHCRPETGFGFST